MNIFQNHDENYQLHWNSQYKQKHEYLKNIYILNDTGAQ